MITSVTYSTYTLKIICTYVFSMYVAISDNTKIDKHNNLLKLHAQFSSNDLTAHFLKIMLNYCNILLPWQLKYNNVKRKSHEQGLRNV